MRWKTDLPRSGDKRVVSCFALWPTKLDDGYTVWLEYYWAEETWDEGNDYVDGGFGYWKTKRTSTKNLNLPDTGTPVRRS